MKEWIFLCANLRRPNKNSKPSQKKIKLSKMLDIVYRHKLTTISTTRAKSYKSHLAELVYYFDDCYVTDISVREAYDFIEYLKYHKRQYRGLRGREINSKIGLSNTSVNEFIVMLTASYNVLHELEYLTDNYNPFLSIKTLKVQKTKPKQIAESDLKKFIRALDTNFYTDLRMKTIVYTFLESYGRASEVCGIKKEDIDFSTGLITFEKTKNSRFRVIPVGKKVLNMIKRLIQESEAFNSEYVFLTNTGDELHPDSLRRHFYEVSDRAGLKKRITAHRIRHTGAIEAVANGMDIRSLQKLLGHSDLATTMIYLDINDEVLIKSQDEYSPLSILERTAEPKTTKARRRRV